MRNRIIALWVHPRSRSTAMERIFIERGDLHILHEPFSCLYYVTERKGTATASIKNPEAPPDYATARNQIIAQADQSPVFFKDMPFHAFDHVIKDPDFLQELDHIFLIRNPSESINSHYAANPKVTLEEIGYEHQFRLFEKVSKIKGEPPVVVDASDFVDNPSGIIRMICENLELPFIEEAMSWDQGQRPEWETWEKWHQDAANSTKIRRIKKEYKVTVENNEGLKEYYDYHLPFYEEMKKFRLLVGSGA